MRSTCTYIAGVILAAPLIVLAPGCDSGTSELEKPPETTKVDPTKDMPGMKDMLDKMKTKGKTK